MMRTLLPKVNFIDSRPDFSKYSQDVLRKQSLCLFISKIISLYQFISINRSFVPLRLLTEKM